MNTIRALTAAYRTAHPDIDWTTNVVAFRKTADGYEVAGHVALAPTIDAILNRCCCHPDQPRGHDQPADMSREDS